MTEGRIVWSDEHGDMRKKKMATSNESVDESGLVLNIRRVTSGKGRTIIEITGLPSNKNWCKKLVKNLKKELAVGGAYKKDFIELHGEKLEQVISFLDAKSLNWKKTGG